MNKLKIQTLIVGAVLAVAVAAPVAALDSDSYTGTSDSRSTSEKSDLITNRTEVKKRLNAMKRQAEKKRTSLEDKRSDLRQRVQERRASIKKDVCVKRQAALENRIAQLSKVGTTIKTRIDSVYEKVTQFYEKGKLTVDDYDGYVEKIEAAKAEAETSLDLVASQSFAFNCESSELGEQLDGFRLSIQEARAPLKDYRKAVVDLIAAMRSAAANKEAGNE